MKRMLVLSLVCISLFGNYAAAPASEYVLTVSVQNEGIWQIATVGEDGSDLTFLTDLTSNNGQGAWSPDGKQVAFTSDRDGNYEIYIMDANGGNPRRLTETNSPYVNSRPSWSPDGKRLAFTRSGQKPCVYIIDVDGQNETLLAEDAAYADWSPDGKRMVLEAKGDGGLGIYVIELDDEDWDLLMLHGGEPKWSPDGKKIVFRSPAPVSQICVMDVKSKRFVQLTNVILPANAISPCWSPDSEKIAYSVQGLGQPIWRKAWIMDANGKNKHPLHLGDPNTVPSSWVPMSFAVYPSGKLVTTWGRPKKGN